jgi:hypothetical protein
MLQTLINLNDPEFLAGRPATYGVTIGPTFEFHADRSTIVIVWAATILRASA